MKRAVSSRSLRLVYAFLTLLFCFSLVHAQTMGAPFSGLVVFGDSLSDAGNVAHVAQSDFLVRYPGPAFNYTDGRFTDGQTPSQRREPTSGYGTNS